MKVELRNSQLPIVGDCSDCDCGEDEDREFNDFSCFGFKNFEIIGDEIEDFAYVILADREVGKRCDFRVDVLHDDHAERLVHDDEISAVVLIRHAHHRHRQADRDCPHVDFDLLGLVLDRAE